MESTREGELMATTRKPARKTAIRAKDIRLPTVAELSALLQKKDAAVQAAKVALKEAKGVRRLARTALAEALDAQAKPAKKAAKK